jgi:hypothetical protein
VNIKATLRISDGAVNIVYGEFERYIDWNERLRLPVAGDFLAIDGQIFQVVGVTLDLQQVSEIVGDAHGVAAHLVFVEKLWGPDDRTLEGIRNRFHLENWDLRGKWGPQQ